MTTLNVLNRLAAFKIEAKVINNYASNGPPGAYIVISDTSWFHYDSFADQMEEDLDAHLLRFD
jgi:hypothetical protein